MATANHPADKVRALQRALYVAAKQKRQRRFHALYDRITRHDVLWHAWQQVRRNQGAAGIDGETLRAVEAYGVERMLAELRDQLVTGRYRPRAVRRVHIPKTGRPGAFRPLGIPGVRDRVVQAATKLVLEPIFEANFLPCSYGFRPRRSAHQALMRVRADINGGSRWVVEVDFADFFGSIDPDLLLRLVARRVSDRRVLRLIRLWLRAGVMENGMVVSVSTGVPQGGVISPLLANIFGHALDMLWMTEASHLGTMVRYADDIVILCRSRSRAQQAHELLGKRAAALHLQLQVEKTRLVGLEGGTDGFDFLGFHHRLVVSRRYGRPYCQQWPSQRAMSAVRARVKAVTAPRWKLRMATEDLVRELNPILVGWGNYFRVGNSTRKFTQIDSYVQERLALFDNKKRRRGGRGWGQVHTYTWYRALGVRRLAGSIRYDAMATAVP